MAIDHAFHRMRHSPVLIDREMSVGAELFFISAQSTKPVLVSAASTGTEPEERFEVEPKFTFVRNLRPFRDYFTLDHEGFLLRTLPIADIDLHDDRQIVSRYIPFMEAAIASELGAAEVVVFDATRRSDSGNGAHNSDGTRGVASRIHVDYTAASGPKRARDVLGDSKFETAVQADRRIVQVNAWRSILPQVTRSPLAVADASTITPKDLIATDQIFPDRIGEIYHLSFDPQQKWYYAPDMVRDEVLFIKGWDSLASVSRFTPHAAFRLPDHERNKSVRESIELRAIAIY